MADALAGGRKVPFNLPRSLSTLYGQDAEFWRVHARWREAEDAFETGPFFGDDAEGELLCGRASDLRASMFLAPISTATALAAKFEAIEDGQERILISGDFTIFDALRRDCQALADAEAAKSAEPGV